MCGFAGFIDLQSGADEAVLQRIAAAMAETLRHRGPDDAGVYADVRAGLGIGFQRLAIIDLSREGHQPMASPSGRYVIVFNGEIYNFRELRDDLEQVGDTAWRGTSDTEVLLAAIEQYGFREALEKCDGMFALALWDREEQTLSFARDRLGEKPLYYGLHDNVFVFGSELKALAVHPGWRAEVSPTSVATFLRFSYVPGPTTIYRGTYKLPPGHMLTVRADALKLGRLPAPRAFWDARAVFEENQKNRFRGTDVEATDRLEALLTNSIRRRLIADVPLGVFLSGGVDSATIAALAQKSSSGKIHTFTVGFDDPAYDESIYARAVAERLGTEHTEFTVGEVAAMHCVERVPAIYDEPFGDVSQLPTLLLSELTRQHVTTVLSGDGGDELFAGYPRYEAAAAQWRRRNMFKHIAAKSLRGLVPVDLMNRIRGKSPRPARIGDKLYRMIADGAADTVEQLYAGYMSRWRVAEPPVPVRQVGYFDRKKNWPKTGSALSRMMFADAVTYLPDDLLVKTDRASMAVSLETRTPMLNHDLVAFAWSLPDDIKLRDGTTKWLLRQVLYRHVPAELIERPKQGFEPPISNWLRGPLRDWAETLLSPASLAAGGFIDPVPVRAAWDEHLQGYRNWHFELWNVLMFEAWRAEWRV
jgi:asparagine synthase (glutamine-hydrolysing)